MITDQDKKNFVEALRKVWLKTMLVVWLLVLGLSIAFPHG